MSRNQWIVLAVLGAVVLVAFGGYLVTYLFREVPSTTPEVVEAIDTPTPVPSMTPTSIPPTPTSGPPTPTNTPIAPTPTSVLPTPTPTLVVPTSTSGPPSGFGLPIMIEVQNYLDHRAQLTNLGPFYLYGWVADAQISGFSGKVSALLDARQDAVVVKTAIMFTSYNNLQAKIDQIPSEIDAAFYNSEPGLSPDYYDIFLEGEVNSVVKFVRLAEAHGLESHWGPMRRNFEPSVSDHVSETAIALMFEAGLDGIGIQEQQQIDDVCVQNIIYGPNSVGGHKSESISELVSRLWGLTSKPFEVNVQIMPGYQYSEGCYPGDAYAQANCGLDLAYIYQHCHDFAIELEDAGLVDSLAIWASQATEREQLVGFIRVLRGK